MSICKLIRKDLREFKAYSSARIEAPNLDNNMIFLDANESAIEAPISGACGKGGTVIQTLNHKISRPHLHDISVENLIRFF